MKCAAFFLLSIKLFTMRKLSMQELGRLDPKAFKEATKTPVVLVLDNIRSALNVGSSFRTADAFILEHIYLCGITATPPHREILKTALGATETMNWSYHKDTAELIAELKESAYCIIAVEQAEDSVALQDFEPEQGRRYALIFGNEVGGVDDKALELADTCLEIPQFGTKHSINVAVCVGIVSWELFRKLSLGNTSASL